MALFMVKTWMGNKVTPIYGAEWAGTSDPSWVRTDDAVGFADPNPYYAGMSTSPSSPFDNIMPWSGMRRVTDANAGELVEIPKFYYKWTRDGANMKLQISMTKYDGFLTSPSHADRGDGVGERDYVYVGRYHCSTSDYKSTSGVKPKARITRATARTNIHNLGSSIWQQDFALWWTIRMLYLVEFGNWDSQACIGYGCGNGSSTGYSGATDNMPYHTGTISTSRSTYSTGIQYRNIEDLWASSYEWCDGIYFNTTDIFGINNPANFSDSTGGTLVGQRCSYRGVVSKWTNPSVTGYEYMLFVSEANGSDTTYVTDSSDYVASGKLLFVGSSFHQNRGNGLFFSHGGTGASDTADYIGCRLMVLPSSRLAA